MLTARRLACLIVLALACAALPATASAAAPPYRVLVFTPRDADATATAGVKAIRDIGKTAGFTVVASPDADLFTADSLARFRAVVFMNTRAGDMLSDTQQAAFEDYFTSGGGYLGVGSAIETEPGWQFLTDVIGTRATGASGVAQATIKVADRVHDASKSLPEYWTRTDRWYNFAANVRGKSHVLATVDESTYTGGTNGFDHPIAWCKDYRGGRSFYTAGGNTAASFGETDFREHLGGAIAWTAGVADPVYSDCGATVLANYQETKVSAPPNIDEPIGFDVLPDGRVLQTARLGQLRLHDPKTSEETVLATFSVYNNSEDGLYGPAIDNDFATNHWVYLYYAPAAMEPPYPPSTPVGSAPTTGADPSVWDPWKGYFQLSRFKFVDKSGSTPAHLDLSTEQKILKVEVNRGACCHVAGDIDFDKNNNLWLVTGDDTPAGGGNSGGFAPFNDMLTPAGLFNAPFVDARRSALNTNDLRGKLLRIRVNDDGTYSVPPGNLFPPGTEKTRPEIYAMGFRNPFRVQIDSQGVAYVTDYSPDSQVPQTFRGPAGTGRVEIVRKPSNYGWPLCYSPDLPYYRWNFNTGQPLDSPPQAFECDNPNRGPENSSRWNTGLTYSPPVSRPDVWYSYRDNATPALGTPCPAYYRQDPPGTCPQLFPELLTGGVGPHGAARYEYNPANANPTKLPPYYDGAVFFGEFTRDYLREIRLDSSGKVFKINNLFNCGQALLSRPQFPFECDNPMDLQFGADGNFYLLTYGDGFFRANPDAGMYRFEYVKGQRAPQAVLNAAPTDGQAPLTVQFSSEGSRDPDPGDSIRFEWDFDNNGTVDSIDANPSHTYTANGVYTAKLTVTDSSGKTDSKTTVITVGNTSPSIEINVPVDGDFFEFGQNIPFTVTVTDPEDDAIDCGRVEVTFVLIHDTHGHAEENVTGCSGVLHTLADDASHGGYLAGGISATYTDNGANGQPPLTTVEQHVVQLKRQEVEFVQDENGTTVAGTADVGGGSHRTGLDPGDFLVLNNRFNFLHVNQEITFRFANNAAAGSPRGAVEVHLDSLDGPVVATATLTATGSNNTFTSQTFPFTTQVTGSHKLYLAFRSVDGGPTAGFGNLNWVGFSGPGIGVNP
jgi:cytochrome c